MEALIESDGRTASNGRTGRATREADAARIERELSERTAAIAQRAIAAGTARGGVSAVVVRHVDPETIRPPGWKPLGKLADGHTHEDRCEAILDALERAPMPRAQLRRILDLNGPQMEKAVLDLERRQLIFKGDAVSTNGGAPSNMLHLAQEEPTMTEPATDSAHEPERRGEVVRLEKPSTSEQKLAALRAVLAAGPRRQRELADDMAMNMNDFRRLIDPEIDAGRLERVAIVEGRGNPPKWVRLPGDTRTEPSDTLIEIFQTVRTCALDGCRVDFEPRTPDTIYHSLACQKAAKREARGQRPIDAPRACELDGCDETFVASSPNQRYHSEECRYEAERRGNRGAAKRYREERKDGSVAGDHSSGADAPPPPAPQDRSEPEPEVRQESASEESIRAGIEGLLAGATRKRDELHSEIAALTDELHEAEQDAKAAQRDVERFTAARDALVR